MPDAVAPFDTEQSAAAQAAIQANLTYRAVNNPETLTPSEQAYLSNKVVSNTQGIISQEQDAANEAAKQQVAFSQPRNDLLAPRSEAYNTLVAQAEQQKYSSLSDAGRVYHPEYKETENVYYDTSTAAGIAAMIAGKGGYVNPGVADIAKSEGYAGPINLPTYVSDGRVSIDTGMHTEPVRDLSSVINQPTTYIGPGQIATIYVPYGTYAQTEIQNAKIGVGQTTGELAIYQQPTGHSMFNLVGGAGRNALQSGMFTVGEAETPYVIKQYETGTAVLPSGKGMSRLGSEPYGGYVGPLDNRTMTVSNQLSSYANVENLANYVDAQGPNKSKTEAPNANAPYALSSNAPAIQYMNEKGMVPGSEIKFSSLPKTTDVVSKSASDVSQTPQIAPGVYSTGSVEYVGSSGKLPVVQSSEGPIEVLTSNLVQGKLPSAGELWSSTPIAKIASNWTWDTSHLMNDVNTVASTKPKMGTEGLLNLAGIMPFGSELKVIKPTLLVDIGRSSESAALKEVISNPIFKDIDASDSIFDPLSTSMAKEFYGGIKPTVVSPSDFNKLISEGATPIVRGSNNNKYIHSFMYGDEYIKNSGLGSGTYTAYGPSAKEIAMQYAKTPESLGGVDNTANLMEMALRPEAKIIKINELESIQSNWKNKMWDIEKVEPTKSSQVSKEISLLNNPGRFAQILGFDAIDFGDHGLNYMLILNRGAVAVKYNPLRTSELGSGVMSTIAIPIIGSATLGGGALAYGLSGGKLPSVMSNQNDVNLPSPFKSSTVSTPTNEYVQIAPGVYSTGSVEYVGSSGKLPVVPGSYSFETTTKPGEASPESFLSNLYGNVVNTLGGLVGYNPNLETSKGFAETTTTEKYQVSLPQSYVSNAPKGYVGSPAVLDITTVTKEKEPSLYETYNVQLSSAIPKLPVETVLAANMGKYNAVDSFAIGAYERASARPLDVIKYADIGALVVVGGGAIGGGISSLAAGTRAAPVVAAAGEAAPGFFGTLYGYSVSERATLGFKEFGSSSATRLGGLASTEIIPMLAGGVVAARPALAYETTRSAISTVGRITESAFTPDPSIYPGGMRLPEGYEPAVIVRVSPELIARSKTTESLRTIDEIINEGTQFRRPVESGISTIAITPSPKLTNVAELGKITNIMERSGIISPELKVVDVSRSIDLSKYPSQKEYIGEEYVPSAASLSSIRESGYIARTIGYPARTVSEIRASPLGTPADITAKPFAYSPELSIPKGTEAMDISRALGERKAGTYPEGAFEGVRVSSPEKIPKFKEESGIRYIRVDDPITGGSGYTPDISPIPMDVLPGVGRIGGMEKMSPQDPFVGLAESMGIRIEPVVAPKGLESSYSGASLSEVVLQQIVNPEIRVATTGFKARNIEAEMLESKMVSKLKSPLQLSKELDILPSKTIFEEKALIDPTQFELSLKSIVESEKRVSKVEPITRKINRQNPKETTSELLQPTKSPIFAEYGRQRNVVYVDEGEVYSTILPSGMVRPSSGSLEIRGSEISTMTDRIITPSSISRVSSDSISSLKHSTDRLSELQKDISSRQDYVRTPVGISDVYRIPTPKTDITSEQAQKISVTPFVSTGVSPKTITDTITDITPATTPDIIPDIGKPTPPPPTPPPPPPIPIVLPKWSPGQGGYASGSKRYSKKVQIETSGYMPNIIEKESMKFFRAAGNGKIMSSSPSGKITMVDYSRSVKKSRRK